MAEDYGVTDFPVLVYFENQVPNVFEGPQFRHSALSTLYDLYILFTIAYLLVGDLSVEEEVLQWLITQRTEDRIELITREMLETSVEETQYLAVYFCELCS